MISEYELFSYIKIQNINTEKWFKNSQDNLTT